ncbi:MAG: hypothetical protein V1793_21140 [Pseudomonadota bacterium]
MSSPDPHMKALAKSSRAAGEILQYMSPIYPSSISVLKHDLVFQFHKSIVPVVAVPLMTADPGYVHPGDFPSAMIFP